MSVDQYINELETRQIPLGEGKAALVDAEDYKFLKLFRWKLVSNGTKFYAVGYVPALKKDVAMHRIIMDAPKGVLVDHRFGDGLDNRKRNLRLCTHSQNMINRPGNGKSSKFKGVSWDKQSRAWIARIRKDGKSVVLGRFSEPEQAAEAYHQAAREIHGEFAWVDPKLIEVVPTSPRKSGRPPKPWYFTQKDAWYVQINGRRLRLANGRDSERVAHEQFAKLMAKLGSGHPSGTLSTNPG